MIRTWLTLRASSDPQILRSSQGRSHHTKLKCKGSDQNADRSNLRYRRVVNPDVGVVYPVPNRQIAVSKPA